MNHSDMNHSEMTEFPLVAAAPRAHLDTHRGRDRAAWGRYGRLGVAAGDLPVTESLRDTVERARPVWEGDVAAALRAGRGVLVATHGNVVRALVALVEGGRLGEEAIGACGRARRRIVEMCVCVCGCGCLCL